jgi:serine/threonine protein kinase
MSFPQERCVSTLKHPLNEILRKYVSHPAEVNDNGVIETHLAECESCRKWVEELRALTPAANTGDLHTKKIKIADSAVFSEPLPLPPDVPLVLGSLVQYTDIRKLGQGGMGEVYLAKNIRMDREEVLKVMGKSVLERPGAQERFEREIRAAGKLNHANIVTAYSSQQVGDMLVLSMEFVPGDDLAKVLKERGPLSIARACYFTYQAALGLQHAHEKGMVHRDIKPNNLILAQQGRKPSVKILDFGLAKSKQPALDEESLTGAGQVLGTPSYIAPEQIHDAASADIRADIYSLGCTLYSFLTGSPPFVESSIFALLIAHKEKLPKPLQEIRSDVPALLQEIVSKMLAKDPKDRYQTPAEVAKALVPLIKTSSTVVSEREVANGNAQKMKSVVPESVFDVPHDRPQRESRLWLKILMTLLFLIPLGTFVSVLLLQQQMTVVQSVLEFTDLDPDAEVFVDGQAVEVVWDEEKQIVEIRVKPGMHTLEIKQYGVTTHQESLEIVASGRKSVQVPVPPTPPIKQPAPNEGNKTNRVEEWRSLTGEGNWDKWYKLRHHVGAEWTFSNDEMSMEYNQKYLASVSVWATKRDDYKDFHFKYELKVTGVGVLFCFRDQPRIRTGNRAYPNAKGKGYCISFRGGIAKSHPPWNTKQTGSLFVTGGNGGDYGQTESLAEALTDNWTKLEWNKIEGSVVGNRIQLFVNGKKVLDYGDPESRFQQGMFSFTPMHLSSKMYLRNFMVQELH